jgi:hypothetical protein
LPGHGTQSLGELPGVGAQDQGVDGAVNDQEGWGGGVDGSVRAGRLGDTRYPMAGTTQDVRR